MLYARSQLRTLLPPLGKHDLDIQPAPRVLHCQRCLDYVNLLSRITSAAPDGLVTAGMIIM